MKQKIRVKDKKTGKVIEGEIKLRDQDHFQTQLRNRAQVFKPKKGKGSFKRKPKHREDF